MVLVSGLRFGSTTDRFCLE